MRKVTEKEIGKLAEETDIPEYMIQKLHSMGLLNETEVLFIVIRKDYQRWKRTKMYSSNQIIGRLASYYDVHVNFVKRALNPKKLYKRSCNICNRIISVTVYRRNNGLCDECFTKDMQI